MRPVAVVGIGKTPFGAFADRDLRSLAVEAGEKCLRNAQPQPAQVESFYLGNFAGPSFVGQNHLAPYVSTALGITGVPSTRIEAACASSGSAFFHAWTEVAAGVYDVVMVVGVEKMTSQPTARVSQILAGAGDCSGEMKAGSTFASLFAMIARRHMHEFGTRNEHLAAVAVKNHAAGALNPDAHMRKIITLEQAMKAKPIAEPLNLYDCSLISDGAAAVLLAPLERAREFTAEAGAGAGHRAGFRLRGARPESGHHHFSGGAARGRTSVPDGGRVGAATSNSPSCTTASPSPRSSPPKTWDSWKKGKAGRLRLPGAHRCGASGR